MLILLGHTNLLWCNMLHYIVMWCVNIVFDVFCFLYCILQLMLHNCDARYCIVILFYFLLNCCVESCWVYYCTIIESDCSSSSIYPDTKYILSVFILVLQLDKISCRWHHHFHFDKNGTKPPWLKVKQFQFKLWVQSF